jgi:lipoprotein LprG
MRKLLALVGVGLFVLAGCSGDGDESPDSQQGDDPAALLADAKKTIDEAASVHVVLTGRDIPADAQAVSKGDGVATHAPAFQGKLTVQTTSGPIDADVVAVDGKVYVKPSFSPSYIEFGAKQLADLGAPDPAVLLDPAKGVTAILPAVKDPQIKGESRQGSAILTEVTGTIPGSTLAGIFPKAPADQDFQGTFKIDNESKQLVSATVTGPFYSGGTTSYDIALDKYGEQVQITKPS